MAKRVLDTIDISIKDEYLDHILQGVVERNCKEVYDVIEEYMQNAVDSSKELKRGTEDRSYPYEIKIKVDISPDKVSILDNCKGMTQEQLKNIVQGIFESEKEETAYILGGRGFGTHKFRAYFDSVVFRTKTKGGKLLEMTLRKGPEHIRGNEIIELGDEADFPYESGTLVVLSGYKPKKGSPEEISPEEMMRRIKFRFEKTISYPGMNISILEDGSNEKAIERQEAVHQWTSYAKRLD